MKSTNEHVKTATQTYTDTINISNLKKKTIKHMCMYFYAFCKRYNKFIINKTQLRTF